MKVASMLKCMKYPPVDLTPETRLYIPFNEGVDPNGSISMAKDYSQYNNHATLTDVEWSPDGFNGAGKFNGGSSMGNCGTGVSLNIPDVIAIELQTKITFHDTENYIISKGLWNGITCVHIIFTSTKLTIRWGDGTNTNSQQSDVISDYANFHYYTVIIDTSAYNVYRDAVNIGTGASTGFDSGTNDFVIGAYQVAPAPVNAINGTIDNVIIRSTARSAAQIAAACYEVVCA